MYMMLKSLRVHNLSKKMTYIKLKVIGCSPHSIHEYFKVNSLLLTLSAMQTRLGNHTLFDDGHVFSIEVF